jgi:2-dehydro-3-deoxygalactonokinase
MSALLSPVQAIAPDWIAVDWGTSSLRAYAMKGAAVVAEASSDRGMGVLARHEFEGALRALVAPWLRGPVDVVACGMVGSRQGWHEAPYRAVPCLPVDPASPVTVPVADPGLRLRIVPGLKQMSPPDVMRGEETQIAGALALTAGFDGVVCLPGTHNKWVHVSAGEVVSFRTCLTGEMFALLSKQSVLRHGMAEAGTADQAAQDAAFDAALSDALSRPEQLATRLFALRAEGLLTGLDPAIARARLSGMLVGIDLAATRPYWLGQPVLVVGADGLAARYARALAAQGHAPRMVAARDATLAGLGMTRNG